MHRKAAKVARQRASRSAAACKRLQRKLCETQQMYEEAYIRADTAEKIAQELLKTAADRGANPAETGELDGDDSTPLVRRATSKSL